MIYKTCGKAKNLRKHSYFLNLSPSSFLIKFSLFSNKHWSAHFLILICKKSLNADKSLLYSNGKSEHTDKNNFTHVQYVRISKQNEITILRKINNIHSLKKYLWVPNTMCKALRIKQCRLCFYIGQENVIFIF